MAIGLPVNAITKTKKKAHKNSVKYLAIVKKWWDKNNIDLYVSKHISLYIQIIHINMSIGRRNQEQTRLQCQKLTKESPICIIHILILQMSLYIYDLWKYYIIFVMNGLVMNTHCVSSILPTPLYSTWSWNWIIQRTICRNNSWHRSYTIQVIMFLTRDSQ